MDMFQERMRMRWTMQDLEADQGQREVDLWKKTFRHDH